MGVGDIGAVQSGAWGSGDETYCVDSWRTIWEHERGIISGRWLGQCDASGKQCGDRVGFSDGAWVEQPWACGFHGDGAGRADGMRGYIVGVGDIGAVQGGARGSGDAACVDDSVCAVREHDGGILSGRGLGQRDASGKRCGDGIGFSDSARVELWACMVHGDVVVGRDGM